jgi:hypothetical protein
MRELQSVKRSARQLLHRRQRKDKGKKKTSSAQLGNGLMTAAILATLYYLKYYMSTPVMIMVRE